MKPDWQDPESPYHAHPTNHRLVPGGSEYSRYLWVKSQIEPGSRVLDVGCNCGQLAVNLTEDLNCEVVGIDLVPEFVEHCRQKKAGFGTFICADFCAMSPAQLGRLGRFDVVTALEVIEHSIDVRRFREHVGHVLKSGGKLIITTPHPKGIIGYDFLRKHPCHVRMWSRWRLERVFGPLTAYEPEIRNRAGALVSIGGVFVCP